MTGNIAVAKCVLGEITDRTNQSRAFSLFGLCQGAGNIIGPTIGGLLADPGRADFLGEGAGPVADSIENIKRARCPHYLVSLRF
jgi:MFS family permease